MKVLLIEDDRFFQKFYSTKLREQNIEIDVASDGDEGLMAVFGKVVEKLDMFIFLLVTPVEFSHVWLIFSH